MAKLKKPIIHFQIPLRDCGNEKDISVDLRTVEFFKAYVKKEIGNKAYILATPFEINVVGVQCENVKVDEITLKEFIEKHDIKYDGEQAQ